MKVVEKPIVVIAIVEVGEDYIDQLITIKTDRCSLEEAKKEARDAGYRVIDEYCHVVPTTHEVQIIVAVEPRIKGEGRDLLSKRRI